MKQLHRHAKSRAFTLMEIAIVLGIIGLVMGAVWTAQSSTNEQQKASAGLAQLQLVNQNMLAMLQGQALPAANNLKDITGSMISAGVITSSYTASLTAANSPWGGSQTFAVYQLTPRSFRESFFNVTYGGCVSLLTQATSCQVNEAGCPTQVETGEKYAASTLLTPANNKTPAVGTGWSTVMTVAGAETLCKFNSGGNNSVEFDYSL